MSAEQDKIPTSKVERASRVFRTSMKVGANYIKHNAQKAVGSQVDENSLNEKNAEELFKLMSQLKGSALKIAQMMSMDNGLLPKAFADKFALAQNSAMALSGPLVMNTFKKYIGKAPNEVFDKFNVNAVYAASIGQVHEAWKDGHKLAVKLQYPGVADSIHSDINLVKPLVLRFIGVKEKDVKQYFEEFEERLNEECDYEMELKNGTEIAAATQHIPNLIIPKYYKELSAKKILTMEWIEAKPLQHFLDNETNQDKKNQIGQALLDFLHSSIHEHQRFHADPHPGNFLVTADNKLVVLDFGCVKTIPQDFYNFYFSLVRDDVFKDPQKLRQCLVGLDMLRESDTKETENLFFDTAVRAIQNMSLPMKSETFYFGDRDFYNQLQTHGEEIMSNKEFRKPSAMRGSRHAIYLHRAFFGLYSILFKLNATVNIDRRFIDKVGV
ncbi:MAG TPA: AarF/UbiB family protein [Chitinophagales bacterium]|jgi:predicted unusual protein kinase regulating ubiquinone biosynthesis (AarF/ABC1/UbiB family)|nr:AarF/UbiB family protein [Chitinophagales bacterium]